MNVYPHSLVVCTDLPSASLSGEEAKRWLTGNRDIAIATLLGMKSRQEVEAHMAKLERHGLRMFVCADCATSDIMSATVYDQAVRLVAEADELVSGIRGKTGHHRVVQIVCKDIFNKTPLVRFCWFFSGDYPKSQPKKQAASPSRRSWWQFWK